MASSLLATLRNAHNGRKFGSTDKKTATDKDMDLMTTARHVFTLARGEGDDGDQQQLPSDWTLSQALNQQQQRRSWPHAMNGALWIRLHDCISDGTQVAPTVAEPLTTLLDEFAALGGLAVLSKHLPMLLCASSAGVALDTAGLMASKPAGPVPQAHAMTSSSLGSTTTAVPGVGSQGGTAPSAVSAAAATHLNGVTAETIDSWVKLDGGSDDMMDEEMDDILMMPSSSAGGYAFPPPTPQYMNSKRSRSTGQGLSSHLGSAHSLPLHSLAAFSLFLGMPLYARTVLKDRRRAQLLLRLALGVPDDGPLGVWPVHSTSNQGDVSGGSSTPFAILPFVLLQQVLDSHGLDTDGGRQLRQQAVDMGVVHLLLACLAVFTQQVNSVNVTIPCEFINSISILIICCPFTNYF